MSSESSSRDTVQEEGTSDTGQAGRSIVVVSVPNETPDHPAQIEDMDADESSDGNPEMDDDRHDQVVNGDNRQVFPQLIQDLPAAPQFHVPLRNGFGEVSDDEDGDPNENVQNGYGFNGMVLYDDEWDAQSAGTHSTDRLSISVRFCLGAMDRLRRIASLSWLLKRFRRRRPRRPSPAAIPQQRENDSEGEEEEPPPEFDPELPARHIYLGEAMEELQGRVMLEEESIFEIPIVVMNFHLIPGQTLPMTVFHAVFQNAIRRCVVNEHVFGVVNSGIESFDGRTVVGRHALGTVAEIYEFQEESDLPANPVDVMQMGSNFALKAKGRQRFNVLEVRRQGDGNMMAKVRIRPEIQLPSPLVGVLSNDRLRYQFPLLATSSPGLPPGAQNIKSMDVDVGAGESVGAHPDSSAAHEVELERLRTEIRLRRPVTKYHAALTPWPHFVYESYDERILVERIHRKLRNELKGLTESYTSVPLDATELSFWLAQNLIMDDSIRLQILKMDTPIQRLRFELSLLQNASRVISCRRCMNTVADHGDIFAMSTEGPQGTYVNPNGYIHETLTVHKGRDMISRGFPSTEASWFQGYSWTIAECRSCGNHLGWKFRAVGRLNPKKFWGLARKSVTFKYDFLADGDGDGGGKKGHHGPPGANTTMALMLPPLLPP